MMMRPLYLEPSIEWQVRLDTGPTLHVSAPGRARSLFLVSRLSRVVTPASASWDSRALLACMRAGVPVLFSDTKDGTIGWCFGARKRESRLSELLRIALGEPDGTAWIGDWRTACQRREILSTFRCLGIQGLQSDEHLQAANARARLCNWHRHRIGRPVGPWLHALETQLQAFAADHLSDEIGDPALIGYPAPGLHLGLELAALLEWRIHVVIGTSPVSPLISTPPFRWAARTLEEHAVTLRRVAGGTLGILESLLRERVG